MFNILQNIGHKLERKDFKNLKNLINSGNININETDSYGYTALMYISDREDFYDYELDFVELLLEKGANPNIKHKNKNGHMSTALSLAISNGHTNEIELLLKYGADANFQDGFGNTLLSLHLYIKSRWISILRLLAQYSDPNIQNKKGVTALMLACNPDYFEVLEILVTRNANLDLQKRNGNTALMIASKYANDKAIKLLINHGANVHIVNNYGETAYDIALQFPRYSRRCAQLILSHSN